MPQASAHLITQSWAEPRAHERHGACVSFVRMGLRRFARSLLVAPLLAGAVLVVPAARAEGPPRVAAPTPAARPTAVVTPARPTPRVATPTRAPAPAGHAVEAPSTPAPAKLPARVVVHTQPATPSLDVSVAPSTARQQLLSVREEVVRRVKAGERPMVIFDIDDTLLTWPRADLPNRQLVPGALAYLKSLKDAGAKIVYITGRHEEARAETVEHLRSFGFPVGADDHLVLNDTNLSTIDYKTTATRAAVRTYGKPVAAFDNEKENARMFRREFPDPNIAVVRLRTTTQRPDSGGDGPITVIDDFTPALPSTIHLSRAPASAPAPAAP